MKETINELKILFQKQKELLLKLEEKIIEEKRQKEKQEEEKLIQELLKLDPCSNLSKENLPQKSFAGSSKSSYGEHLSLWDDWTNRKPTEVRYGNLYKVVDSWKELYIAVLGWVYQEKGMDLREVLFSSVCQGTKGHFANRASDLRRPVYLGFISCYAETNCNANLFRDILANAMEELQIDKTKISVDTRLLR